MNTVRALHTATSTATHGERNIHFQLTANQLITVLLTRAKTKTSSYWPTTIILIFVTTTATSSFTSPEQTARWVGIAQSVLRLATVWTVRGSNSGRGGDFPQTFRPLLGQNQPLWNGWGSLSRALNQPGPGVDHPPPNSAEVKGRVEIYRY
jgi:hypothetical protein